MIRNILLLATSTFLGALAACDPTPPSGGECSAPSGAGTTHQGSVASDETWSAADSPHVVTGNLAIDGATLTLEPCAVVRLQKGFGIDVGATAGGAAAALVAHGEVIDGVRRPVSFRRDVEDDPWGFLRTAETGRIDLEHVDLSGGGDPDTGPNLGGTLIALGAGGPTGLTANLRVVDVVIEGSGGFGVNLQARSAFTDDSSGLVITGAGALPSGSAADTSYPVYLDGPALTSLPEGSYTGNARDEIFVANASSMTDPVLTIHHRGVPYLLSDSFGMAPPSTAQDGGLSILTLEAGVTLRVRNGGASSTKSINLGVSGGGTPDTIRPVCLIAEGTAAAPITLTSADDNPAPGAWGGIEWAGGPPTGNVMSFVRIEYAGADSGTSGFGCGPGDNDAALIFTNWRPTEAFIQDSTFADSAAGGIVAGWISDEDGPDLKSSNTFTNIANGCELARWQDSDGCPADPPLCL